MVWYLCTNFGSGTSNDAAFLIPSTRGQQICNKSIKHSSMVHWLIALFAIFKSNMHHSGQWKRTSSSQHILAMRRRDLHLDCNTCNNEPIVTKYNQKQRSRIRSCRRAKFSPSWWKHGAKKSWSTNGEQQDLVATSSSFWWVVFKNRIANKRRTIEAHVNELIPGSACHVTAGDNSAAEL